MADDWEDDDFGTFESADVASPAKSSGSATSSPAPAWLLNTPTHQAEPFKPNLKSAGHTSDTDSQTVGDQSLSTLQSEQQDSTKEHIKPSVESIDPHQDEKLTQEKPESIASDGKAVNAYTTISAGIDAFADIFAECETTSTEPEEQLKEAVKEIPQTEIKQTEMPQKEIRQALPALPAELTTKSESKTVLDLRNQLDNAILLREQSNKDLQEIREELASKVREMREEREKREEEHRENLEKVRAESEREREEQIEASQKAMTSVTHEYTELCARVAREQRLHFEHQLGEITEKCLTLLAAQERAIELKVTEAIAQQSDAFQKLLDTSQESVDRFVTSRCDDVVARCSEASEKVEEHLKVKVNEALEDQVKSDAKSKKEALEELTKTHKENLERALREEREKHCDVTKKAVEDARRSVMESVKADNEQNRLTRERHLTALRMLMTSSQEHLRLLVDDPPPSDET